MWISTYTYVCTYYAYSFAYVIHALDPITLQLFCFNVECKFSFQFLFAALMNDLQVFDLM